MGGGPDCAQASPAAARAGSDTSARLRVIESFFMSLFPSCGAPGPSQIPSFGYSVGHYILEMLPILDRLLFLLLCVKLGLKLRREAIENTRQGVWVDECVRAVGFTRLIFDP